MAFPDRIERTIEITRPLAAVWAVLTTAEGLGTWFGNSATIDLRPGGTAARIAWSTGDKADLRIERVEEPTVFGFTWHIHGCPTTTRAAPTSSSPSNRSARERG
jgi:uncharacterized protein YndB with AHSA1/START domain